MFGHCRRRILFVKNRLSGTHTSLLCLKQLSALTLRILWTLWVNFCLEVSHAMPVRNCGLRKSQFTKNHTLVKRTYWKFCPIIYLIFIWIKLCIGEVPRPLFLLIWVFWLSAHWASYINCRLNKFLSIFPTFIIRFVWNSV